MSYIKTNQTLRILLLYTTVVCIPFLNLSLFLLVTMAGSLLSLFNLSFLLSLLSNSNLGLWPEGKSEASVFVLPPTCSRIECPSYEVVSTGNGFEIRRYNSTVWMSTSAIEDISLVGATRTGFLQLFDYISGKNKYQEKIDMTGPVITQVIPSDGPFCKSSFVVSFYVPKDHQPNPPPSKGLKAQKWDPIYVAVRQFSGFVHDSDVGEEAYALRNSLAGTLWGAAVEKGQVAKLGSEYVVAQYNSPFEFEGRINEIWLLFDME